MRFAQRQAGVMSTAVWGESVQGTGIILTWVGRWGKGAGLWHPCRLCRPHAPEVPQLCTWKHCTTDAAAQSDPGEGFLHVETYISLGESSAEDILSSLQGRRTHPGQRPSAEGLLGGVNGVAA